MKKAVLFSFLVSVAVIAFLLFFVDLKEIWQKILSFGILPFIIANIVFSLIFLVRAAKWKLIADNFVQVSFSQIFHLTVIGFFVNNFFPARIGEIARGLVLSAKTGIGKGTAFSTVVVDRITDTISILAIFFLSLFFVKSVPSFISDSAVLLLIVTIAVVAVFVFSSQSFLLFKPLLLWLPVRGKNFARELSTATHLLKKRKSVLVWFFSLLVWVLYIPLYYYILAGLGVSLGFWQLVVVVSISSLSAMIPSSPGHVGTFEAAAIFSLQLFGVDINTAASFAVISHIVSYVSTTVLGFIAMNRLAIGFSDIGKNQLS